MDITYTDADGQLRYRDGVHIVSFKGGFDYSWRAGFIEHSGIRIRVKGVHDVTDVLFNQQPRVRDVSYLLVDDASGITGRGDAPQHLRGRYV